jgi:histidinol-phosphate aminotransferase
LARRLPNVVILRTFSKAWGLAGLRLGYALASDEVARQLRKLVPPFAVSVMQAVTAEVALANPDYMRERVERTIRERERFTQACADIRHGRSTRRRPISCSFAPRTRRALMTPC